MPAINGKKKNVVDVDIPFDKPINCDMQIDTENKSAEESVQEILKKLSFNYVWNIWRYRNIFRSS